MSHMAFEITSDDVESVLHSNTRRMINTRGLTIDLLAAELFNEIDTARVIKAALATSNSFEEQVHLAYAQIQDDLVALGVLKF